MSYLADNIRYLRLKNEMTQETLAERLGRKSYTTIQKWESGVAEPPIRIARQIAELFGVSIDDLTNTDLKHPKEPTQEPYYLNDETREIAQAIFDNPQYKALFDASRKLSPEDLRFVMDMIDRMRTD